MKRFLLKIVAFILRLPIAAILKMYLWLWDEEAKKSPDCYLHQKLIWELRRLQKELTL